MQQAIRRLVIVLGPLVPDLLLFLAGQACAWFYLRTGRFWFGFLGTALLWGMLDAWLLLQFAFADEGPLGDQALFALRATAGALVACFLFAQWRRRWSAAAKRRDARFATGTVQFLRSEFVAAKATFLGLVRTDPWDAIAWIWLGDVYTRTGELTRARRCYRRAAGVDTERRCGDLLQLGRLSDLG